MQEKRKKLVNYGFLTGFLYRIYSTSIAYLHSLNTKL